MGDPSLSPLATILARNLRRQRRSRGWSVNDVAIRSRLDDVLITRIEAGEGPQVRLGVIERIAGALDVPIGKLLRA
jgi:transcriptional regulator with XRE-family HTH domain